MHICGTRREGAMARLRFQSLSSMEFGIGHAPMRGNAQLMPFLEPSPRRSLTAATSCLWTNPSGSPGSSNLSAQAPKNSLLDLPPGGEWGFVPQDPHKGDQTRGETSHQRGTR